MSKEHETEEYQLPEDEVATDYLTPPPVSDEPTGLMAVLKNRRLWVLVGLVLAVLLVYYWISPRKQAVQLPRQAVQQRALPPAQPAAITAVPAAQEQVGTLQNQVETNKNEIQQLNAALSDLRASQQDLTSQLNMISDGIRGLTQQIERMVATQKKPRRHVVRKRPVRRAIVRPTRFYLKAVVPGRAWIESTKGFSFTVRIGDPVSRYYGRVTEIKPVLGIVRTSNGRVIRYGLDDS